MTIPDPAQAVSRTTTLLGRMGYSPEQALKLIRDVAARSAVKASLHGHKDAAWLSEVAAISLGRLRGISPPGVPSDGRTQGYASTTQRGHGPPAEGRQARDDL